MHNNAILFEKIYKTYYRPLLRLIKRKIFSPDLAEDILQDAFIKIWNSLSDYDPGKGGLYTWMATICCNMAIDHMRSRHYTNRYRTCELELMIETIDCQKSFLLNTDSVDVIKQTMELKQSYTDVMMLFYYKGYTQVEIGGLLNLPLGTVKSRMRVALGLLRKIYH